MSTLWAPNLSTSENSGSLQVWLNANDATDGYLLSGTVKITDKDFGENPIIRQINNLGTLGGSLTRLFPFSDVNSPQLMTGTFSSLNGFKFGYTGSNAPGTNNWKETRMSSTIMPPTGDSARQLFMVTSQVFHGSGSRGPNNFKFLISYGKKSIGKEFGITVDGTGDSADRPSMDYFGQDLNASTALMSFPDPFGFSLIGYSAAGGTNGQTNLHFNGNRVGAETRTLATERGSGLFLGGLVVEGSADTNTSDFILHELLIYDVGTEGNDDAAGFKNVVEGYLAHKWGFSNLLPSDHPYKSSAPPAIIYPTSESTPPKQNFGPDFTINQYQNMTSQYRRFTQIPFSKGLNGVPNLRKTETAYSASLGKTET